MTRGFDAMPPFPLAAPQFISDPQLRANLRRATGTIRAKRQRVVEELPDFDALRAAAEAIKDDALAHLDSLLAELERNVVAAGGHVHYASDAASANALVVDLVRRSGADEVVKVKSMTTAEIGLNDALAAAGIDAAETDLAELIVQLGGDLPSHIVVPAIHRNRNEIRDIFLTEMGARGLPAPADLTADPAALAAAARAHLRQRFLRARVGISSANFAVAETGSLVVVESEGNGRMCLTLPETLISIVGIEKVIPRFSDLEVFLQLLARSATGERMSPYTSIWRGVDPTDGPRAFHLVLLDNGRTSALKDRVGRQALRCIRCAACLNVCPVYERVGGHAYGSVYPGPIGAVLAPQLEHVASDPVRAALPFASTLCGACFEVCPVRIDIPRLLVHLRARSVEAATAPSAESVAMHTAGALLQFPAALRGVEAVAGQMGRVLGRVRVRRLPGLLGGWTSAREVPVPAAQSFRSWWRSTKGRDETPTRRHRSTTSATGCTVPTSWLAHWQCTRETAPPERSSAASTPSGSIRPTPSTGSSTSGARRPEEVRTDECSTPAQRTAAPGRSHVAAHTAAWTASVAPEVKTTWSGRTPRSAETCSRAVSMASRTCRPSWCTLPGSPAGASSHSRIAAAASGRRGDVEAWSR